jgi:PAS domain S-box-containing protein
MIRILILEDVPSDAKLIKSELEKADFYFESQLVGDKKSFIEMLEDYQPDLVLSDYSLPQFTGLEAIELVQLKTPKTPIIIVTGSTNEETAVNCMKKGAWDYILKDRLARLGHSVKNAMELKLDREEIQISQLQIRESEEKYRNLYETANDAIFLMRDYIFISCNPKTLEMYGCEETDIVGHSPMEFSPEYQPDGKFSADKALAQMNAALTGQPQFFEWIHKQKNGTLFNAEVSLNKMVLSDGTYIHAIVRNTNERKKAENELKAREELYREQSDLLNGVFNSIPDIMGVQDAHRNIIQYNQAGYEFLGVPAEEAIGKKCYELVGRKEPCVECTAKESIQTKKLAHIEKLLQPQEIWLDVRSYPILNSNGEIVKIIEHLRDITARKKAELKLVGSEEQFRTFAENVPGVVSIYDLLPDGSIKFKYMGPGLDKFFGPELAEKIYETPEIYFKMIPLEDREHLEREAVKALNSDKLLDVEYRLEVSPNNIIWVRSNFRLSVLDGNIYRWQGIIFEITEKKFLENNLIKNEQLLLKTQKMASLGSWKYNLKTQKMFLSDEFMNLINLNPKEERPSFVNVLQRFFPEEKRQIRLDFLKSLREKSSFEVFHRIRRPDGEVRFVQTKTELVLDDKGNPYETIGMTQDITQLVQAQKKEQEQIENIKLLNESAMHFVDFPPKQNIYHFIAEKVKECVGDSAYIFVNSITIDKTATIQALIGDTDKIEAMKKIIGKSFLSNSVTINHKDINYLLDGKIHCNEKDLFSICLETLTKSTCNSITKLGNLGDIYSIGIVKENQLLGTIVILLEKNKPKLINVNFLETFVTQASIAVQKREAEKALIESEKLSSTVIEDSPIGISVRDKFGTLILYNKSWKKIWDMPDSKIEKDMIKRSKLHMDTRDSYLGDHQKKIKEIYEKGGSYFIPEMKLKPDGSIKAKWVAQRFYAIRGDDFKVERIVILTSDISERKNAEIVQSVLYNITHQVNTTKNLDELFKVTHHELGRIIDTKNYFIALRNEQTGLIQIPYSRDEMDKNIPDISSNDRTLSSYVMETGKPLLANEKVMNELTARGEIDAVGSLCRLWLGVPLKLDKRTIGVIVVQSYTDAELYTSKDLEILTFVSNEIALAIDKKRKEEEISIQKTYFENLFQMSPDALVIADNEDKIIQINDEFEKLFGYSKEEAKGIFIDDLIVPEELKGEGDEKNKSVAEGNKIHFESVRQHKNGKKIFIDALGKPIVVEGNKLAVQGIYRDISERKKHEEQIIKDLEEKEILLKEVHHRVKNNMQIISSMLKLQSRYIDDEKALELFKNSQNRVKSMALIHERIYKSPDLASVNFEDYVKSLGVSLFLNYGVNTNNVSFETQVDSVSVNMNTAIPLGLIINELISNALKHAFPQNRKGKLKISFSRNADGKHKLIVEDNGVGIKQDIDLNEAETLGMQLVNALTSQLQGSLKIINENGTKVRLTF